MRTPDIPDIETLFTLFEHSSLTEFSLTASDLTVVMKRQGQGAGEAPSLPTETKPIAKAQPEANVEIITSPIVGTFYLTPAPDAPPYISVGSTVKRGDVLCTIEAMKLMNQLEAEYSCQIVKILAKPETMVEFGSPLFEVKRL